MGHPIADRMKARRVVVLVGLALGLAVLTIQLVRMADPRIVPTDDFVAYWAAGRLNAAGGNPYVPDSLLAPGEAIGEYAGKVTPFWYPPWSLPLLMPFGMLAYPASRVLWLILNMALVLLCSDWIWCFYGGSARHRGIARVVGLTFAPSVMALSVGQIGPFLLLGVTAFLIFERRGKWWLAGASTVLVAVKPQLLYLFWIALVLWVLQTRRWRVLAGAGLAGMALLTLAWAANHAVLWQYLSVLGNHSLDFWLTPTIGAILRQVLGWDRFWLQFVAPTVGAIWFLFYWHSNRLRWVWADQMPVLLLVSASTVVYGWLFDQVVLLVPVIQVYVWICQGRLKGVSKAAVASYVLIDGLLFATLAPLSPVMRPTARQAPGLPNAILPDPAILAPNRSWGVWVAPTLLIWYLAVRQRASRESTDAENPPA